MNERILAFERPAVHWRLKLVLALVLAGLFLLVVFLLGSRAEPAVAIVYASKTYSLYTDADLNGVPSPGDTLLYTVVISNSGDTAAFSTAFADSLADANLSLVTGTVQTTQGSVLVGNNPPDTTVAVQVGDVAPSGSVTITFRAQIADPMPPGVVDVLNQGQVVYTDTIPETTGTDDPTAPGPNDPTIVPILRDPALIAQKTLVGADTDAVAPNFVTFTIAINNVGLTADVLSMTDDYDPFYLSFVDAAPYPDEDADDGTGPPPRRMEPWTRE